jgi:hypothetical protein
MHYWLGMGDLVGAIAPSDPRFSIRDLDPEEKVAALRNFRRNMVEDICTELFPIKDQCIGLLEGNHEKKFNDRYFADVHDDICIALKNQYGDLNLGYSAIIKWKFHRKPRAGNMIRIYAHHGAGGGRKKGAKVNRLNDLTGSFPNCHIYISAHVHDRICWTETALDVREQVDELMEIPRAFGVCGTFQETYARGSCSYAEMAQYPSTSLGVVSFIVTPFDSKDNRIVIETHMSSSGLPA